MQASATVYMIFAAAPRNRQLEHELGVLKGGEMNLFADSFLLM